MDRGAISYILAFMLGITISGFFIKSLSLWLLILILVSVILCFIAFMRNKSGLRPVTFWVISHLILLAIGFESEVLHRHYFPESSRHVNLPLREELKNRIEELVQTPSEQAVLIALTLGDKSMLPRDLKKAYGDSGAMHILALSGLHMAVLYGFVSGFLFFLNTTRRLQMVKAVAASLLIVSYGYMTGFPPSVQRAIMMILLQNTLYLSGRKTDRMNLIASTAFIILIINPSDLFSISFQLSFAAVLGITFIFPVIEASFNQLYPKHHSVHTERCSRVIGKWIRKGCYAVWCLMGISISCQITTLPFTLFYFKSAPEFFILTNLVAIPIASAVLYLFIPAVILFKVPILGEISGMFLQNLLEVLNKIIQYIGHF